MCIVDTLGYAGSFLDPVTEIYPLGNGYRMYLPWLMRFNAPDSDSPFGLGGINSYAYCMGDPINSTDPTGHAPPESLVEDLVDLGDAVGAELNADRPLSQDASIDSGLVSKYLLQDVGHDAIDQPGPSTSAANPPAAHAPDPQAGPPLTAAQKLRIDRLFAKTQHELQAPGMEWIVLKRLPSTDNEYRRIFNKALRARQIKINYGGGYDKDVVLWWDPRFKLKTVNGLRELSKIDYDLKGVMVKYGAAQRGASSLDGLYEIRQPYGDYLSRRRVFNVALELGEDGFHPLIMEDKDKARSHTRDEYTRAFRLQYEKIYGRLSP